MPGLDPDIALRFHQGDLQALQSIILQYQLRMLRLGAGLLGNRDAAADLAQDVFVHVYQQREKYDPARPFEPWLYAVAVNLGRQILRRRREIPMSDMMPEQSQEAGQEKQMLNNEKKQLVQKALCRVPVPYRESLLLRFQSELSLKEIARVLGISLGTVKSRLSRGLAALRRAVLELEGGTVS
jgi:RNA polymerase sigma-70 factor, ECF subfamily